MISSFFSQKPLNKAAHTACGWTRTSYACARPWRRRYIELGGFMPRFIFIALVIISANAYSEINKCVVDGKTIYTQSSCPSGSATPLELREISTTEIPYKVHFGYLKIDPGTHMPTLTQETRTISVGGNQNWGLLVVSDSKQTKFSIMTEIYGNCEWNGQSTIKYGPYKTQWQYYWPLEPEHAEKACSGAIKVHINNRLIETVAYEVR